MSGRIAIVEHGPDMSEVSVDSVQALDALLDQLTSASPRDAPWTARVVRGNGDSLTIGLGPPLLVDPAGNRLAIQTAMPVTVLSLVHASGDPPYYASHGSNGGAPNVVFFFGGHWSEFPSRHVIGVDLARRAVREFVTSPELPVSVRWEEV